MHLTFISLRITRSFVESLKNSYLLDVYCLRKHCWLVEDDDWMGRAWLDVTQDVIGAVFLMEHVTTR